MRQWKKTSSNEYSLDHRKREDILNQIKQLAASYVPEWQFDTQNPDIGSVIALLYADQMQENLKKYNLLLERDYVELMNMLGISLKPAFPSHSIAMLQMETDTIDGQKISKGIKLLGESKDGEESYVFETAHSVYLTGAKIQSAFMTSAVNGKVVPVIGTFPPVEYVEGTTVPEEEEFLPKPAEPFTLFDFSGSDHGKYGLLLYHTYLFDVVDNEIWMELKDGQELIQKILNGEYRLYCYTENGFEEISNIREDKDNAERLIFQKDFECKKLTEQGSDYSILLIEPVHPVEKSMTVSGIGFSSVGRPERPQEVWNGNTDLAVDRFLPFGETLALYSELYIGHNNYFSKPGAQVTISFQLEFDKHLVAIPKQVEEAELKIIKRKPKKDIQGAPADVFVDEIALEYFNGTGWRKLVTDAPVQQMFRSGKAGRCQISFRCPKDWEESEAGAFSCRCIRIQLIKSDNCYYQPALHYYPVIRDMQIEYTYEHHFENPQKLVSYVGSKKRDITLAMTENSQVPVFMPGYYDKTSLYLGLDRKIEDGPVSLYFQIQEREGYTDGRLAFSYSTRDGFSRLKIQDHTAGFSHTGIVLFMPPSDMAKKNLEGREAYWIQITDENSYLEENPNKRPVIEMIDVNAVEVDNIETLPEDEYYMDSYGPNMKFQINARNILSTEVWVNESGIYSGREMQQMLDEMPERAKAEYNYLGEIEEFYVLWDEVDNFDRSTAKDRHYMLDRMNSCIYFGDGVHVRIPKNTRGTAFKVITHCCNGSSANIEKGQINDTMGTLAFVDTIYNPIQVYGGMDMENMDVALHRGTVMLNSRNCLVSALDYEREVLNFSQQISQAKVISGQQKDGSYLDGSITIALLMEDYKDGSYSFLHLRPRLKEHLLTKCELSVDPHKLNVVEPFYVEISVEAWVKVLNSDDTFEVQQDLIRVLEDYLDPIKNDCWEIGRSLSEKQIELRLGMEKKRALIRHLMITAAYIDDEGRHETDLASLKGNPYLLITSGKHKIHFE